MSLRFQQTIFDDYPSVVFAQEYSGEKMLPALRFAQSPLGVSMSLSADGINAIAFSTTSAVFYIPTARMSTPRRERYSALGPLLNGDHACLAGFTMARLALHIKRDLGLHVSGVDLSTIASPSTRAPWSAAKFIHKRIDPSQDRFRILELWCPAEDDKELERLCLRAWVSAVCASHVADEVGSALQVSTRNIGNKELDCLGQLFRIVEQLELAKPSRVENEFRAIRKDKDSGDLELENSRFKTRVRKSENTKVIMETSEGRRLVGQAVHASGKTTRVQLTSGSFGGNIERIRVEGREELTCAENARDEFLLRLLQGESSLRSSVFIDMLWFPSAEHATRQSRPAHDIPLSQAFAKLNDSQRLVAAAMVSRKESLVIAHGPPGTGKTTTIAAAVDFWTDQKIPKQYVWIVAQSNVAVKNIARSLFKKRFFDFKLLVSKEFHFEWHEHLYKEIERNLIRSDELFQEGDFYAAERMFEGCRVVLCTLSMLSNQALDNCGVFRVLPVLTLVVDEASQINVFEFMHLFHKFKKLEKVCFFGDPKQLPPYGQDVAPGLQSIFDVKHLKARAYFLNIQYRMPVPLGEFISKNVYNEKLLSSHSTRDTACVRFVNVSKGMEQQQGKSWINQEEVNLVVELVQRYYRSRNFCVITPYDAQRAEIQKALERAGLPHDRVFNVDSFQGHQEEYVIISAVRTERPGFLSALPRNNVMLTRCTKGMVVVSNSDFILRGADRTLLGKLAHHWAHQSRSVWIDWRAITSQVADLPGAPAPKRTQSTSIMRNAPIIGITQQASSLVKSPGYGSTRKTDGSTKTLHEGIDGLERQMGRLSLSGSTQALPKAKRPVDPFPPLDKSKSGEKGNINAMKGRWKNGTSETVKRSAYW